MHSRFIYVPNREKEIRGGVHGRSSVTESREMSGERQVKRIASICIVAQDAPTVPSGALELQRKSAHADHRAME